MVKNQKKDTKKETNDIEVYNKIIDLCLWNQIQDSHHWIELLSNKIKIYELRRDHLLNNKQITKIIMMCHLIFKMSIV